MKVNIGIFNVRGLNKSLQAVYGLLSDAWIPRLCGIWIEKGDDPITKTLDETVEAQIGPLGGRVYGEMALTIIPSSNINKCTDNRHRHYSPSL